MHIHLNLPSIFKSVPTNFRSIGWLDTEFIIKYIVVGIFKYTMGNTAMLCNIYGIMDILFIFVRYSLFSKGRRVHKNMKKGKKTRALRTHISSYAYLHRNDSACSDFVFVSCILESALAFQTYFMWTLTHIQLLFDENTHFSSDSCFFCFASMEKKHILEIMNFY